MAFKRAWDCLTSELRASANFEEEDDSDDCFVWSDDTYGDLDGAGLPELPVSRIPDGLRAELVLNALQATLPASIGVRRGIRNLNRAFADRTFQRLPGRIPLVTADPLRLGQSVPLSGDVAYA